MNATIPTWIVDICPVAKQQVDNFQVAMVTGFVKRGPATVVLYRHGMS